MIAEEHGGIPPAVLGAVGNPELDRFQPRAGETFRYSESGPVGLLKNKRAIVTVASGGTEMGSDFDFATGYLQHILGFVGITDVTFVAADRLALDAETSLDAARASIESLPLAA